MKTLELKLKKDVLIVDLPQEIQNFKEVTITNNVLFADGKGNRTCLFIKFRDKLDSENTDEYLEKGFKRFIFDYIEGDYEFLCKGSELTEEIASELVKMTWIYDDKNLCRYKNYNLEGNGSLISPKEAIISAVESKDFYWLENPIEIIERGEDTEHNRVLNQNEWQEAEEKTFKNPLIFIKK